MDIYRDNVKILILPDTAHSTTDEQLRNPQDITICPLGYMECSGDCECYVE